MYMLLTASRATSTSSKNLSLPISCRVLANSLYTDLQQKVEDSDMEEYIQSQYYINDHRLKL